MKLYNTLSRKKETFKPIRKGKVSMYVCGPTVYDYAHIGNFRAYIVADLLRRYLEYRNYKVKQIMNLTDVDDKTIKGSQEQGVPLNKYTNKYKKAFFEDLKALNIKPAFKYPEATKHIKEMVSLIQKLLKKDYAYKTSDGIYFSIRKFKDYGKLSRLKLAELKIGARVKQDQYEKQQANDFALWKFQTPEDGNVFWETPFGKGRPGWHIECSAMSMKYLGQSFDIHTGGTDLIFPHHENEIAQSQAATGKKFVNFWVHNEWLVVEGKKMSKSLGNFYTLRDLEKKYPTQAIRYLLLATHYRQKLNLTFKALNASKEAVKRINDFVENAKGKPDGKGMQQLIKKAQTDFKKAMDNDLETPKALSTIFNFIRQANKLGAGKKAYVFIKKLDKVLGVVKEKKVKLTAEVKKLLQEREKARKQKDFKKADKIRKKIREKGYIIEDTPTVTKIKPI